MSNKKSQQIKTYSASDYGEEEVEIVSLFKEQRDDAKAYFINVIRPRLDRSYKLYISDNSDRALEIKKWQANVFVPYIHAVVETLKPRILDARPDFSAQGRTPDDQPRAARVQILGDYTWEKTDGDTVSEDYVSSSLIYGTGYIQVGWKRDVREYKFLKTKDITKKKYTWVKEKRVFYDAPFMEWVDNYSLWYDWHNVSGNSKQYWFKRLILTEDEIKRRYPMADKDKLAMALGANSGDLTDYAAIRNQVKLTHELITKGADHRAGSYGSGSDIFKSSTNRIKMHEVFEWFRPFADTSGIFLNDVPILKNAVMPNPYDFKDRVFIDLPFLRIPGEFEGYGLPMILENPQIMLNMTKNQRLDAMTLNIHKMWVINPLANINKQELVSRPFGIIYSSDPAGVREVQTTDIKASAYKEEEMLKSDMRYASGVDDFSMGAGGGAGSSATEVRHLRESTLERVRLFVNHLGKAYSMVFRNWISLYRQFWTKEMIIRITGDDGEDVFPVVAKDDLFGDFDLKAEVIPSIAGQNDIKKKQDMDLLQLLMGMEFLDQEKVTSKVLHDWNWNINDLKKEVPPEGQITPEMMAAAQAQGMTPEMVAASQGMTPQPAEPTVPATKQIPADVVNSVLAMLSSGGGGFAGAGTSISPLNELSSPVNLLKGAGTVPPTPQGVKPQTTNPRGLNRGGKVNTNIATSGQNSNPESALMNRTFNLQG